MKDPFLGKVATGKGPFLSQERLRNWERSFPFPGKLPLQLGKVSAIFGTAPFPGKDPFLEKEKFATGKGPFLSQNGNFERFERGKERKAFRPSLKNHHLLF